MQFTQRQQLIQQHWRPVLAVLALGLLLGFAGPFGSNPAYPRPTRYAFWLGLTTIGALAALAAIAVLPADRPRKGLLRIAAVTLLSALPMTFVVAWTITMLQPGRYFTPLQLPALLAAVAAIQLVIAITLSVAARRPQAVESETTPEVEPAAPAYPAALLGKLPPLIGCDILALETEDHYLRVHTTGGSALILMRMSDAVATLDPRLGTQVHRRWWVARSAVRALENGQQRLVLCLRDGRQVPVGRTFSAEVKASFTSAT